MSYKDYDGQDLTGEQGFAIRVITRANDVAVVLGNVRRTGSFSEDAWTNLSPDEARELAADLCKAAATVQP